MSEEWDEYMKDPRSVCKYGAKCYQKNPEHHKKFKHPPQQKMKRDNRNKNRLEPYAKRTPLKTVEEPKCSKEKNNDEPSNSTENESERVPMKLPEDIQFYDKDTNNTILEELFLVKMPSDFYKFYECLTEDVQSIEKTLESVNLEVIGPYDLLLGKLPILENKELYLIHWRFFFDPPEFQAVLKKKKSEYHIGYFRDDPNENPVFVANNDSAKDCRIRPMAVNIFGAVYSYLQNEKKHSPFTAVSCQKLMHKIKAYADKNNFSLEEFNMKKRLACVQTKTFHGAGIVVPYDKKTELGYRRLVETDANLKKLFTKLQEATSQDEKNAVLSEIQPVLTYASIAVDECDFGTGLEAGIAMFCSGLKELEPSASCSLVPVYDLLNRKSFSAIIKAHLKNRRKGSNMSLLNIND